MAAARRFRPTFDATIILGEIETKSGAKGPYAIARGSSIVTPDGVTRDRTVMAFGDALAKAGSLLHSASTVRLAVQLDGGTVIVKGPAKSSKVDQPNQDTAPIADRRPSKPTTLLDDCLAAAGFGEHATYGLTS